MVSLDKNCIPQFLVEFSGSDRFAVVCSGLSLQWGSIGTKGHVELEELKTYRSRSQTDTNSTVIITAGREIKFVTFVGQNSVLIYTVNDVSPELITLPSNIHCMATGKPTLIPLHTKPAVLLQCNTTTFDMVVYVVPIPIEYEVEARSLPANGLVYSSQDGTYVLVVNGGPVLSIYHSEEMNSPGKALELHSRIITVDNLDSDNVRILTEENGHLVINLKSGSLRVMPGGLPVLSEWVESSNHYIYLTEDKKLIVVNDTSTEPEYEPVLIANEQEMMLFVDSAAVEPTPSPSPPSYPSPTPPPSYGINSTAAIAGGSVAGVALLLTLAIAIIIVVLLCKWRNRNNETSFQRFVCTESGGNGAELHTDTSLNSIELVEMNEESEHLEQGNNQTPDPPDQLITIVDPPVPPTEGTLNSEHRPQHHNNPPNLPTTTLTSNTSTTLLPQWREGLSSAVSESSELPSIQYPPPQQATPTQTSNTNATLLLPPLREGLSSAVSSELPSIQYPPPQQATPTQTSNTNATLLLPPLREGLSSAVSSELPSIQYPPPQQATPTQTSNTNATLLLPPLREGLSSAVSSELPSIQYPQATDGHTQQHTTNTPLCGTVLVSNTNDTSVESSIFTHPHQEHQQPSITPAELCMSRGNRATTTLNQNLNCSF